MEDLIFLLQDLIKKRERSKIEKITLGPFANKDMFNVAIEEILTMNIPEKIDYVNWKKYVEHYGKYQEGDEISSHLINSTNKIFNFCNILTLKEGYEIEGYPIKNENNCELRFGNRTDAQGFADALGVSEDKIIFID